MPDGDDPATSYDAAALADAPGIPDGVDPAIPNAVALMISGDGSSLIPGADAPLCDGDPEAPGAHAP